MGGKDGAFGARDHHQRRRGGFWHATRVASSSSAHTRTTRTQKHNTTQVHTAEAFKVARDVEHAAAAPVQRAVIVVARRGEVERVHDRRRRVPHHNVGLFGV